MSRSEERVSSGESFVIKQPLKLYKSRQRRYVRLEISAPLTFAVVDLDRPLESINFNEHSASILNISAGGVLMTTETALTEGTYIALSLELQEIEIINGIIGKVKRAEGDGEGGYLVGVEFCTEAELISTFGESNIGSVISSFDDRVKRVLLKYIFNKKVAERLKSKGTPKK